jgi:O-antigen/teichoic acid export membrane protein
MLQAKPSLLNGLAMVSVYGANILVPLITLPFLTRMLGAHVFGQVMFITSVVQLSFVACEYGFHITGTKDISVNRSNNIKIKSIVDNIISAKIILIIICSAAYISYIYAMAPEAMNIALWGIIFFIGQSLDPFFYFMGTENIKKIAFYNVAFRLLGAGSIYLVISSPDDAWLYFLVNGLSWIAIDLVGLYSLHRAVGLSLSVHHGIAGLKSGWQVFQTHLSGNIFDMLLPTALLFFSQATAVSYFVASDKMVRAVWGLLQPLRMLLFPRMAYLVIHDRTQARKLLPKASLVLCGICFAGSILIFCFASQISVILYGVSFKLPPLIVEIMSPLPFLLAANNMIGFQWLVPVGYERPFKWLMVCCGVWRLGGCALLASLYAETGAAIAVVSSEGLILLGGLALFRHSLRQPLPSHKGPSR